MLGAYAYKCPFFTGDNQARDGSTFWVRCEGGELRKAPEPGGCRGLCARVLRPL